MHAYLWCFSVLFKIVRPISGESSTKLPIWGHHTQIHRFYGIKRWNTMRKKISNFHKPRKKCSRHAHESAKPRLWQIRALEVGAEKIFLDVTFISKRALGGPTVWMYVCLYDVRVCGTRKLLYKILYMYPQATRKNWGCIHCVHTYS